jgi:hypothetical protein
MPGAAEATPPGDLGSLNFDGGKKRKSRAKAKRTISKNNNNTSGERKKRQRTRKNKNKNKEVTPDEANTEAVAQLT